MIPKILLKDKPHVIGHRGACGYAPENTLTSFQKARELGIHWVEFDVMLCADEEAIIIHDPRVNRTTNGCGEVIDLDYPTLAQLDAGSWFAADFAGEKIPTLIETLAYLTQQQMAAVVEIKPYPGKECETAEKTVNILNEHWPKTLTPPIVASFSIESLKVSRKREPNILIGMGLHQWDKHWSSKAEELNCVSIHINHRILNAKKVASIKDKGYYVFAYTVNDSKRAQLLFSWGVDAVFSDFPDRISQS